MDRTPEDILNAKGVELLDALFDGVYVMDRSRKILLWNSGAERITGYARDHLVGMTCLLGPLHHESEDGCFLCEEETCPALAAIKTGKPVEAVVYALCADGVKRPMETHIQPLIGEQGEIIGAIEIFRDISNWKRVEALSEDKDRMMGMLSHDIRNPLTVIMAYSILLAADPDEKLNELGKIMERKSRYALALVNNLLDAQAIESGSIVMPLQRVNLALALRESVANFAPSAEVRHIRLEVSCSRDDLHLSTDPIRFEEIMNNLISNALKFSPDGSAVRIAASDVNGNIEIAVSDSGPGITPEDQQKLFKPFGTTGTRPAGGEKSTGLGLYIIKKLLDLHRGTIAVDSTPGRGATFTLRFPADPQP